VAITSMSCWRMAASVWLKLGSTTGRRRRPSDWARCVRISIWMPEISPSAEINS